MRTFVIVKLVILFLTLALVIWALLAVREGSMEGFFASMTGVDPTKQINLCPNRIHAIEFEGGRKIEESHSGPDMLWAAHDGLAAGPRPLNYLAIEKWLGEHCYVDAAELKENLDKLGPFRSAVKIQFIDQSEASLMQNSANPKLFSWDGRLYESAEMAAALTELQALAGWK